MDQLKHKGVNNLSAAFSSTQVRYFDRSQNQLGSSKYISKGNSLPSSRKNSCIKPLNLVQLQDGIQTSRESSPNKLLEPYYQQYSSRAIENYINKGYNDNSISFQRDLNLLSARDNQSPFQFPILSQTTDNNKNTLNSGNNNNNASILSSNGAMSLSFVGNNEEISQLKGVLNNLISKEEDSLKNLQLRASKLNDFMGSLTQTESQILGRENEFVKMRETMQELSNTLITAARNEIELGASCREIERIQLENRHLTKKHVMQHQKNVELHKIIDTQMQRIKALQEENNKYLILLTTEKKEKQINNKKVNALEKRVEFILENEVNILISPKDKLRQSLNELLRENESLKRDLIHKNQEIERNLGNIKRMSDTISRLNTKIDSLKKEPLLLIQKSGKDLNQMPDRGKNILQDLKQNKEISQFLLTTNMKLKKNDDIDLFSNFVIPFNLDFRVVSLRADHQNLIADLIEEGKTQFQKKRNDYFCVGSVNFTKQVMSSNNQLFQKEAFNLISSQFLSFKELSEKVNLMISEIHKFIKDPEWKDSIPNLNSTIANIFNAYNAHVWILDSQSGILVTYEGEKEKKILIKGLIGEAFFSRKPINCKNARNKPLLYLISKDKEENVIADTCLIVPIIENKTEQVKMIVEISNSKNEIFSFDEEYLSIILAHYLSLSISWRYQTKIQQSALKFNGQLLEELDFLMLAKSKYELAIRVKQAYHSCFGISSTVFYFVENNQLVKYNSETSKEEFALSYGLAGQAVSDQKPYLITDIKHSSYYNKLVDLHSILPIIAIPLLNKNEVTIVEEKNHFQAYGVIEIALKQKFKSATADKLIDGFSGYFGLEESLQTKVEQFSQIIVHAIKHFFPSKPQQQE